MNKIFLDYGHGGSDPGSVANGYKEKDLTLKFGLKVAEKLRKKGFVVGESRTTDIYVDLDSRGRMMKGYDYGISIHLNAGGGLGYEFLVPIKENLCKIERLMDEAFKPLGANTRSSRCYSKEYYTKKKYPRSFDGYNFGESYNLTDWFSICRESWAVGTSADIFEMAFIDNKADLDNFLSKMDLYADAIVSVLCKAFNVADGESMPVPQPEPDTPKQVDNILGMGDTFKFQGTFSAEDVLIVDGIWCVLNSRIGGYIPCKYVTRTDVYGNVLPDQDMRKRGDFFIVEGTFTTAGWNGKHIKVKEWNLWVNPELLLEV